MISILGKGVSAGVAIGPLYFYQRAYAVLRRYEVSDREAEWKRFKAAQAKAIEQLGVLAGKAGAEAGDEAAMLFETHRMMCRDPHYEETVESFIKESGLNAEAAVSDAGAIHAEAFTAMDDDYFKARAADVMDISGRIVGILSGVTQGGIDSEVPVILAADDLAPSEIVQLDKSKLLGFATFGGSGSSHTAILARTMGIPAIIGVGGKLREEYAGREVIIDGGTGAVVLDADEDTRLRLMKKRAESLLQHRQSRRRARRSGKRRRRHRPVPQRVPLSQLR